MVHEAKMESRVLLYVKTFHPVVSLHNFNLMEFLAAFSSYNYIAV